MGNNFERAISREFISSGMRIAPNWPEPPEHIRRTQRRVYIPRNDAPLSSADPLEIRVAAPLVGRAFYWGEIGTAIRDGYCYQFMKGAFDSLALDEVDVRIEHAGQPVASTGSKTLKVFDDGIGLGFQIDENDTALSQMLFTLVRSGQRRGVSARFVARDFKDAGKIRCVRSARLKHLALTNEPAFTRSWVAAAELGDTPSERVRTTELEIALRQCRAEVV